MNEQNKIVVFFDQVGRTILGERIDNKTNNTELVIKDPAVLHTISEQQTGQLQLQILPLFFRDFLADKNDSITWTYKRVNITEASETVLNNKIEAQYRQMFSTVLSPDATLDDIANLCGTDKGPVYHGYTSIYEPYLSPFRDKDLRLLEIGVCMEYTEGGHSLKMWNTYFRNARIYAFDIVDMSKHPYIIENNNITFYQGDQSNRANFISMYDKFESKDFDVIIEDGSHIHEHQMISLGHLFKYVKSGGYYILEDMSKPDCPAPFIRNDETYLAIKSFQETGKINSNYLTLDEKKYLEENISKIEIFNNRQNTYAVAILTKK